MNMVGSYQRVYERHVLRQRKISAREYLRMVSKIEERCLCTCLLESHKVYFEEELNKGYILISSHSIEYGCEKIGKIRRFAVSENGQYEIDYHWHSKHNFPPEIAVLSKELATQMSLLIERSVSEDDLMISWSIGLETFVVTCDHYNNSIDYPMLLFRLRQT